MLSKSILDTTYQFICFSQRPTYTTESWIFCHELKYGNDLKEVISSSRKWAFKKSASKYWDQGSQRIIKNIGGVPLNMDEDEKYTLKIVDYCREWFRKTYPDYPNDKE